MPGFFGHEAALRKIKFFATAEIHVILKQRVATDHAS